MSKFGRDDELYEAQKFLTLLSPTPNFPAGLGLFVAGQMVWLMRDGELTATYAADGDGLNTAAGAAASGDTIWVPQGILTRAAGWTLAAGVGLVGLGINTVLEGPVTLGSGGSLKSVFVSLSAASGTVVGVEAPSTGTARMYGCRVMAAHAGTGNAYGVRVNDAGSLEVMECYLKGTGGGGSDGYGGYRRPAASGILTVVGGTVLGSTDAFNE